MMITLQGVVILRISDFRRFFDWGEFWAKKDDFISLFRSETNRRVESQTKPQEEYYFVDNDAEFYLMQRLYEWLVNPNKELQRIKLDPTELKIETNIGDTLVYPLGRLQSGIENIKKQNQFTNKTIVGYTLLYLLLGANDRKCQFKIDFGATSNLSTKSNDYEIKEFEPRWDDVILDKIEQPVYPLRRCIIVNKNQNKDISVICGNNTVSLKTNECVIGLFCGDKCLQLLDNVASDYDSNVTLKLSIKGTSLIPICEVHRSTGIEYIEGVSSIAVEADGNIVYSTMDGDVCYNKDCFSLDLRISSFKEKEYSKDLLAFKKDSSGNYIFYCKNKINY